MSRYNDKLTIGVKIWVNKESMLDDPAIGLYSGYLVYVSTPDSNVVGLRGVLAEDWLSSISKSVDIRRCGNYASLNGSSIKISNNFGLKEWLDENNVSLSSKKLEVFYRYEYDNNGIDEVIERALYTGKITQVDSITFDYISIVTESISKGYEAPTSERIEESEKYKPLFVGPSSDAPTLEDESTYVKYTKGVAVKNGEKETPYNNDVLIFVVTLSTQNRAELKCVNKNLTVEDVGNYRDSLKELAIINKTDTLYLSCVTGAGKGDIFPFRASTITAQTGISPSLIIDFGFWVDGETVYGSTNTFPDGLQGEVVKTEIPGSEQREYIPPLEDVSLVKIVLNNEYVQMDGFKQVIDGYLGKSYFYDSESDSYLEAPSFGGGFINFQDRMIRDRNKGDSQLDFKEFDYNGTPTKIESARPEDLAGLTIDHFPEDIQEFFVFEDEKYINYGWWGEYNDSPPVQRLGTLQDAIDGNLDLATEFYVSSSDESLSKLVNVIRLGLPQFSRKPNSIALTMRISLNVDYQAIADAGKNVVGLLVNNLKGWNFSTYQVQADNNNSGDFRVSNIFPDAVDRSLLSDAQKQALLNDYNYIERGFAENERASSGVQVNGRSQFILDVDDYILDNVEDIFLVVGITTREPFRIVSADYIVNEIAWSGQYETSIDNAVFSYIGRSFDSLNLVDMTHISKLYEHILRLQNFSSQPFILKPINGWGSKYPEFSKIEEDWDNYIDSSINYGGTGNPQIAPNGFVEGQKLTYQESNTKSLKKELCRGMWSMGTIDNEGKERVYPIVNALKDDDGVLIEYSDIKGDFSNKSVSYNDIFVQGDFLYNYQAASQSFGGTISITNVDKSNYDSGYIIGVEDDIVASKIWKMANALYKKYGIINNVPQEIGEVKLMKEYNGIIDYIISFFEWQGVTFYGNEASVEDRYYSKFTVGFDFYVKNNLDHGSKVKLAIPTITDEPHKGIITDLSISPTKKNPTVSITASVKGDITGGGSKRKIIETGSAPKVYIETGSAPTIIKEG